MSRMMLTASVLCLAVPCSAMAAASHTKVRYEATQELKALMPAQRMAPDAFTTIRFAIRGRTATWDFTFNCNGYRCKFQNSHHAFSVEGGNYVAISEIFESDLSDVMGEEMMFPSTGSSQTAVSGTSELCEFCVTESEP